MGEEANGPYFLEIRLRVQVVGFRVCDGNNQVVAFWFGKSLSVLKAAAPD